MPLEATWSAATRIGLGLALALALAACTAATPPPFLPLHRGTEAPIEDTTTAMVIFGGALSLGGGGVGAALRVERQATPEAAYGIELSGGHGEDDTRGARDRELVGVRAYGVWTPAGADWFLAHGGVGFAAMDTGLVGWSLDVGTAVSVPSDLAAPYLHVVGALAVPLRRGDAFGGGGSARRAATVPSTDLWFGVDLGVAVPLGEAERTQTVPSLGLFLYGAIDRQAYLGASLGLGQALGDGVDAR